MCEVDKRRVHDGQIATDREGEFIIVDCHSLQQLNPFHALTVHQLQREFKCLRCRQFVPRPAERIGVVIASTVGKCVAQ